MAGREKQTKQAPEPLGLVQRLVNTRNLMRRYDLLEGQKQATRWLEESGYGPPGTIGEAELARLRALRERLRGILLSHNPGASSETAEAASGLSDLAGAAALGVGFDPRAGRYWPLLLPAPTGSWRTS